MVDFPSDSVSKLTSGKEAAVQSLAVPDPLVTSDRQIVQLIRVFDAIDQALVRLDRRIIQNPVNQRPMRCGQRQL